MKNTDTNDIQATLQCDNMPYDNADQSIMENKYVRLIYSLAPSAF